MEKRGWFYNAWRRVMRRSRKRRIQVRGLTLLKVCPGGNHAWYDSNVGVIRKPIGQR